MAARNIKFFEPLFCYNSKEYGKTWIFLNQLQRAANGRPYIEMDKIAFFFDSLNSRHAAGVLVSLAADLIQHFAVIMDIPRKNLKLPGEGEISVANLKCDPRLIGAFREEPGIFPGWHMNKAYWLSVALDGTVDDEKIKFLVDMSYELTKK